ncbi:MAG: tRNA (N6-isopentenyl adenosine(37)-C2)-methylthiotransferase MiaB [Lachnospiraceae bacterium]|nr:tRNA (N6-isopentenyl adenosine(37)-C2)-methylthiotransferase MiaB [Lachnospiraceae bacterium]
MEYLNMYEKEIQSSDLTMSPPTSEPERQYYYIKKAREIVAAKKKELNRDLTCHITTFGCQMNARDSEKLLGVLENIGYVNVEEEDADIIIFNTCTVRENANQRLYGHLGQLKNYKKKHPNTIIGICGCMMQEEDAVKTITTKHKHVNILFGTHNLYKFAEILCNSFDSDGVIVDVWKAAEGIVEDLPVDRKYSFKSGVNISFGCNNFCSYCIVPYVRGRERSREPKAILREIERLCEDGVTEVMLLGQNVNSYGKDLDNPMTFAELLDEVEKIEGLRRIRFMTSHPKDLSDELIEVMARSKKICKHFHLPLQSGSSRILKDMNRRYDKERYLSLVEKLRKAIPDIAITTDIIVGYPGETEEDFLETMDVVERVKYDSAFTFIYSKRTGTPAASNPEQVDEAVVKDRFDRLLAKVQKYSKEQAAKHVSEVTEVLVENVNEQDDSLVSGRMSNNSIVHFPGDKSLIGKYVDVKLVECKGFYYIGEVDGNIR